MGEGAEFQWIAVLVLLFAIGVSGSYRHRAEQLGSPLSEPDPDRRLVLALRAVGLVFWLSVLADPPWMRWSTLALPSALRWLGAALALLLLPLFVWIFRTLGENVSPAVVTRKRHTLVTSGPYAWVRHPLYAVGLLMHAALALLLASWLVALAGLLILAFILPRARREEERLVARFGDSYREYAARTGMLVPRLSLRRSA